MQINGADSDLDLFDIDLSIATVLDLESECLITKNYCV